MIIGKGLLASAFQQHYHASNDVVILASGVSNSKETSAAAFQREQVLIEDIIAASREKTIVYFSTYSIMNPELNSESYVLHKIKMEKIIRRHKKYLIFRLSNVFGKTDNPNTILNFLINRILCDEEVIVWKHAVRNVMDVEDIYRICDQILKEGIINKTLTLTNPYNISVQEIVSQIADYYQKKPEIRLIEKGNTFVTNPSAEILRCMNKLGMEFNKDYLQDLLRKYSIHALRYTEKST